MQGSCKSCYGDGVRQRRLENPEKQAALACRWQKVNSEKHNASVRRWYQKNKNEAKYVATKRRWIQENSGKKAATKRRWKKARYAADSNFRLLELCRSRIWSALKGKVKAQKTSELIGCSIEHLRLWLTFYFQPGMLWENYGDWHVDHIKPCASFDMSDPAQQRECFHYTNLQPLWAADNIRKGAKV